MYYQAWEYQALDNTINHCRNVLIQSQAWFWNYWRRKFILKIDFDRGRSDYLFILIVNHFLQMTQSWHCLSKFKGMNNQVILGMTQTRLQLFKHIHITIFLSTSYYQKYSLTKGFVELTIGSLAAQRLSFRRFALSILEVS